MKDYIADDFRTLLSHHNLAEFSTLWALELDTVDLPNTGRGGWSSVSRLELADDHGQIHAFYLKRQIDHLSRSLRHPLGEATFAREFRNIRRYQQLGIPALEAAYFGQRRIAGKACAMLVTRALDDFRPLDAWLHDWPVLARATRRYLVDQAAALIRTLHRAGRLHNCLYPKHIFIRPPGAAAAGPAARLIDLEKTRRLGLRAGDQVRDLDTLNRHTHGPRATERLRFLLGYTGLSKLDKAGRKLARAVVKRETRKAARR